MSSTAMPDTRAHKNLEGPGIRARIQKFGGHLAGMIMPNIGAFIAWGLITALFIADGWLPNETLAAMVSPMLYFLLPILIGYTGGRMVHGQRGAVIGGIATLGAIMGGLTLTAEQTDGAWGVTWNGPPMFLGAMLIGPLSAWLLQKLDKSIEGKVPSGFEMLIDNFSLGILGMIMAIIGRLGIGPVMDALVRVLSGGVQALINAQLLPLVSIFIEPAKVLFLNNAINHGILSPLGIEQANQTGRSILFMVESNPGAGLGLLCAYALFGPKALRPSTPGAIIIHFFGGIHEIFFPYVLMKPVLILGTIAGSMSGLFVGSMLGAGLVAPASPGSIFAYLAVSPRGGYIPMLAMVLTATAVSFAVCSALLGFGRGTQDEELVTPEDTVIDPDVEARHIHAAHRPSEPTHDEIVPGDPYADSPRLLGGDVRKVIIACDAGMGSSVMVSSTMKKKLAPYGVDVTHTPVDLIPSDAQVVLTQEGLVDRARETAPHAVVIPFAQYMGDPAFTRLENAIKNNEPVAGSPVAAATASTTGAQAASAPSHRSVNGSDVKKVIIACDAGMGSSVMVAATMKKKLAPYGVEVTHTPVDQIPADAQVVLTQEGLVDRARKTAPASVIVPFKVYMGDPAFTNVENAIKNGEIIE